MGSASLHDVREVRDGVVSSAPDEAAALLLERHRAGELAAGAGDVWKAGEGLLDGLRAPA